MDLKSIGYDHSFSEHAGTMLQPGQTVARVMAVDRGAYLVQGENYEGSAELSGRLRFAAESSPDLPCVGDWVCVEQASTTLAIIHQVLPRKTVLQRKRPGKTVDFQMIAANLDVAFIIQSCHYDFNIRRLDRYLVVANESHIEPVIVLSKTDLVTPEELDTFRESSLLEQYDRRRAGPVPEPSSAWQDILSSWLVGRRQNHANQSFAWSIYSRYKDG